MWIVFLISVTLLSAVLLGEAAFRFGWITIPDAARRVGCIDGLRGYLALSVFIHHCFLWLHVLKGHDWGPPPGNVYANLGQAAVAIFFMITAVLFYPKALRRLSDTEWMNHFISRIFRLTPLLWVATAAVAAVVLVQNEFSLGPQPVVAVLCLLEWLSFYGTPNLFGHAFTDRIIAGVTWSLVYEWGFYLSLPACSYFYAAIRNRVRPLPLLLAFFGYFEWLIYRNYVGPRYYVLFVIGMIVAELIRNPKIAAALRSPWAAIIGLAGLLTEFLFCPTAFAALPPILLAIFFAPVAAGNSYFKSLSLNGSIVLGEISYGIYLLHGILLYVVLHALVFAPGYYLIPLLAPLVIATAMFTHRFVEAPSIALGKRMAKRLQQSEFRPPWTTSAPALASESASVRAQRLS